MIGASQGTEPLECQTFMRLALPTRLRGSALPRKDGERRKPSFASSAGRPGGDGRPIGASPSGVVPCSGADEV